ncbi:serine/threonine-protein kinase [Planotetraspora kaengkrachanensis]|nr:serine/threonine-protein kinase [Planotetraspora kaengkrachanensis]
MARGGNGPQNGMPRGVRPLTVGDPVIIGRYLLLGRLGSGGMGVVYLAERPEGGLAAVKTPHSMHLSDPTLRARFAEEAEFSRRVVPFHTATAIEDGFDNGRPYLVTEYIPGPSLSQVVVDGGPLTPDLAYGVALGAAAALLATHEAGLVHRDLKPANVLLSPRGPYVIDFGIARDVDAATAHTQAGQIMGSPGWVAPERLTGGPAIPASDVFSWGCLVAFAATGLHPFGTGELDVVSRRILVEEPRIAGVPRLLWDSVSASLRKEPAERPDAGELLSALLAVGGIAMPGDVRDAVGRIMAEIWQPVPYPEDDEEDTAERPAGRTSRRRAGGHVTHAGFAALATVTIAAMTVVATGSGVARLRGGTEPPPPAPVVMPGDEGVSIPQQTPPPPSPSATGLSPIIRTTVTATASPPIVRVEAPLPPLPPVDPCFVRAGRPKDCVPSQPSQPPTPAPPSPAGPQPSPDDSGVSPQPSPSPVPSPEPSPSPSPSLVPPAG